MKASALEEAKGLELMGVEGGTSSPEPLVSLILFSLNKSFLMIDKLVSLATFSL